jgi:hypothetical protein
MVSACLNHTRSSECGAALPTVILISLLLGTACIAMLSAVAASSRNNTDVLGESKAYYAAESGLQATINFLRYDTTVSDATKYSYTAAHSTLDTKLTYTTVGGVSQVVINSESGYSLSVTDPDNSSGAITYTTVGTFQQADGTYAATRVFGSGADTLTVSYNSQASTTASHPITSTPFGSFRIVKSGNGPTALPSSLAFRVDYIMSDPRAGTRTIRGTIGTDGSVTFLSTTYSLMGSTITLCNSSASCTTGPSITIPAATTTPQSSGILYAKMTPIEPYRLKILSTGYGPNGATKRLEGIVQRNYFNDLGSSAAISMVGPNAYFRVGASAQMDINGGSVPSITVSDTTGLNNVLDNHTNGHMSPAPEIASNDVPDWQRSTTALNNLITQLRQTAQNSGRYFNGTNPTDFGNFSTGTGITFCEGSCTMGGNSQGGGILVVTGTFTTSGNPKFNGLVLAVGQYVDSSNPGGVVRAGGGNETFTGNIVIAPYDPNNLAAGFEQPRYDQSGGPGDTINSDVAVDQAFDGTSAISDFILGVAEK